MQRRCFCADSLNASCACSKPPLEQHSLHGLRQMEQLGWKFGTRISFFGSTAGHMLRCCVFVVLTGVCVRRDTAGQERYATLAPMYYRYARLAGIFVFEAGSIVGCLELLRFFFHSSDKRSDRALVYNGAAAGQAATLWTLGRRFRCRGIG
jgi:hypothetical protein